MEDALDQPALKRRKITQASRILSRPFVSPLVSASHLHKATKIKETGASLTQQPCQDAEVKDSTNDQPKPSPSSQKHQASQLPSSSLSTHENEHEHVRKQPYHRSTVAGERGQMKQIRQLERQIRAVRSEIDTLERAALIQKSSSDDRLHELIDKWRITAQAAADELFPSVQQRIMNMGGIAAWRDTERAKFSYGQQGVDAHCTGNHEADFELHQGKEHEQLEDLHSRHDAAVFEHRLRPHRL
ncbi:hypothetical protein AMS68_002557 [Peltaster fructicola]|uniref:Swi5-dependent recombination DNA repair protein 1 homolog n=1 Tax=Peltaster fructicola TaxID=286661 RepID=A0A6H0XRE6_9PEZI|nr:hypothetical protein AMS68_002557 [Peltaster fructicola]